MLAQLSNRSRVNDDEYQVGDLVILTKNRQGLIRFIGHVDFDGGGEIWFGIELLGGSIGDIDGSIHGKRYFVTREDGGILVLESKIVLKIKILMMSRLV